MRKYHRALLILCAVTLGGNLHRPIFARGGEVEAKVVSFDTAGKGAQVVAHPAADGKKTMAIDVGGVSGNCRLQTAPQRLEAGRYRITLYARLHSAAGDDMSRLVMEFTVGDGSSARAKKRVVWTQFDSGPYRFTPLEFEFTLPSSAAPTFDVSWQQTVTSPTQRVRPIRQVEPPAAPKLDTVRDKPKRPALGDDLLSELENENKVTPLAAVNYPALLIDRAIIQPIGGKQFIEAVRPRYLHVYPGQPNPIQASIRNLENRPVNVVAQLEIRAGLDELLHSASQTIIVPPASAATCDFAWPGSDREFGLEARVTLTVDGTIIQTASEYFSVSFPIWKTALQASGFLTWYGREQLFEDHVAANRAKYLNVEEAFSWQPSSWTNLNPETDHWWSGQGDAHNSLAGLKQWIDLSHRQGIKMITYLWPTASGPEGLEWARKSPELVTHGPVGFPAEFFDVEDLRLKPITEADPRLWRLRSGIWNYVGVNRGMLRGLEKGLAETVASAERFGWDGARFDKPPNWSAMPAEDMHAEFARLKVEALMKQLVPEYFGQTTGDWSEEAVSVANARYASHRLRERDPRFALSYNFSAEANRIALGGESKFFDACCASGGQIMDEEIRQMSQAPWHEYLHRTLRQGEATRKRDGYHCVVAPNATSAVIRCYAGISTFVSGSHPYGDFGWSQPMPGAYTQFMTRYGEFCWARDLVSAAADEALFSIDNGQSLWWRDLMRRRSLADGSTQWVIHLVSEPPADLVVPDKPGTMVPWRRGLHVGRQTSRAPVVWALTAEPSTHAMPLQPVQAGNRYVVEVPEHRLWTVLVWTEPAR